MSSAPRYGSDLIVDLLVEAGVEHVAFNPGASFRGIHDSLVNHREDGPEVVLCAHEGIAVAAAHAYAKASGKPMAALVHNLVGLQNATMAIYNSWCDRAPLLVLGGTGPRSKARRRPWIDWIHTAADEADLVRDYVKWDDEPHDAESVTESFARAYHAAVAEPRGPVYLSYDLELQERELPAGFEREAFSSYAPTAAPGLGGAELDRIERLVRDARMPVIVAGHVGHAFAELAELAELCGAPVVDTGVRLALPSDHDLNATGVEGILEEADAVLALDLEDPRGTLGGAIFDRAEVIEVGLGEMRLRGWAHDYQALAPSAARIAASADVAVGAVLERVRAGGPPPTADERRRELADRITASRAEWLAQAAAATGDDAVPLERLVHDVGRRLEGERFVLANGTNDRLEHRTWTLDQPRQYLGWHGGGGLGYGLGATIGAALASEADTISVDIQADGDLLFTPAALWTISSLERPALIVVANNRQYANTVGHAAHLARARGRPVANRHVGASLAEPPVDFATLARSFGLWSAGPVADPEELDAALAAAIEVVRGGRPALIDVLTPQL